MDNARLSHTRNNVLRKSFFANAVEGTTLSGDAAQKFTAISSYVLGHFRA
jgi:hypothetical protein